MQFLSIELVRICKHVNLSYKCTPRLSWWRLGVPPSSPPNPESDQNATFYTHFYTWSLTSMTGVTNTMFMLYCYIGVNHVIIT